MTTLAPNRPQAEQDLREILVQRIANHYMGEVPTDLLTNKVTLPATLVAFQQSIAYQELFVPSEDHPHIRRQQISQREYIDALPVGEDGWPQLAALVRLELALRKRNMEQGLPYFGVDYED